MNWRIVSAAAIRPGQGASAIEPVDGQLKPEVDPWQIELNGDAKQKEAELIWEVQRSRRMMGTAGDSSSII